MALSAKITFYVILGVYLLALMQNLAILPAVGMNTMPTLETGQVFSEVSAPSMYQNDATLGLGGLVQILPAIKALIGSIVNVVYIMPIITGWGLPMAYAAFAQSLLLLLYGFDIFQLWRGYEIL